jgi:hypothetical protein
MYGETEAQTAEQRGKEFDEVEGELWVRSEEALRRATEGLGGDVAIETDVFVETRRRPGPRLRAPRPAHLRLPRLRTCAGVLLGGVSRRLTAEAHCPVIVLPRGVQASLEALMEAPPAAAV